MNELITTPNYSENKLAFKIDDKTIEDQLLRKHRIKLSKKITKTYKNIKHETNKHKLSYKIKNIYNIDEINGYIELFKTLNIDLTRFYEPMVTQTTLHIQFIKQEFYVEDKQVKIRKEPEPVILRATLMLKHMGLKESAIEYLLWKAKDIHGRKKIYFSGTNYYLDASSGHNYIFIDKTMYLEKISELKQLFNYHIKKVKNATRDEALDYNVQRLLKQEIKLKSHIEMRQEREQNE